MNWLLKQLLKVQINILQPMEGDVLLMQGEDRDQMARMAYDLANAKDFPKGIPIVVLQNGTSLEFLREAPSELKDRILEMVNKEIS